MKEFPQEVIDSITEQITGMPIVFREHDTYRMFPERFDNLFPNWLVKINKLPHETLSPETITTEWYDPDASRIRTVHVFAYGHHCEAMPVCHNPEVRQTLIRRLADTFKYMRVRPGDFHQCALTVEYVPACASWLFCLELRNQT